MPTSRELGSLKVQNSHIPIRNDEHLFIDADSSHRHDSPGRKASKSKSRETPYQVQKSKHFLRTLEIAKKCKTSLKVMQSKCNPDCLVVNLKHNSGCTYTVKIGTFPTCDCKYCTKQQICCDIVWVFLYFCEQQEDSPFIFQRSFTVEELVKIIPRNATQNVSQQVKLRNANETMSSTKSLSSKENWLLIRYKASSHGKEPKCANCKYSVVNGNLTVVCDGQWMPPYKDSDGKHFSIPRRYYFCPDIECIKTQPYGGLLTLPPQSIIIQEDLIDSLEDDYRIIHNGKLPLVIDETQ